MELPYLEQGEDTEPLTLIYSVENGDGSRTEVSRMNLDAVMSRFLDDSRAPAHLPTRARMVAFALRQLAEKLDRR